MNFGIGCVFSKDPGSTFSECPSPGLGPGPGPGLFHKYFIEITKFFIPTSLLQRKVKSLIPDKCFLFWFLVAVAPAIAL